MSRRSKRRVPAVTEPWYDLIRDIEVNGITDSKGTHYKVKWLRFESYDPGGEQPPCDGASVTLTYSAKALDKPRKRRRVRR